MNDMSKIVKNKSNILHEPVLVVSRGFQAHSIKIAKKALKDILKGRGRAIETHNDSLAVMTLDEWMDYSNYYKNETEINGVPLEWIGTGNYRFIIPHVISLGEDKHAFHHRRKIRSSNTPRVHIFRRDMYCCQYCGKDLLPDEATVDHVNPKSRGGKNDFPNLVTCCFSCNSYKADRTPEEAGMVLLRKPTMPNGNFLFNYEKEIKFKAGWKHFL